ncbi:hypothetical protein [uncultured Kordia sp.]|uniref:hypothetical protein n=1 Tax=uncultured Kordia sp. TaxID=507699 RepID=UPI00262AB897|nr:hypothetical protein [uncultured Kordia sp.]
MKTTYLLLITLLSIAFTNCTDSITPKMHFLTFAIDQTEGIPFSLSYDQVLQPMQDVPLHDGIELSIITITDFHYADKYSLITGTGEIGWFANDHERLLERKKLFASFREALTPFYTDTTRTNRSDIYRVVIKEVNELAQKSGSKTLIIDSNLQEHSFFSVYNKTHLHQLFHNLDAVVKRFESAHVPHDDLSGITVIIAQSPTPEDQKLFTQLLRLYKNILEPRGATLQVGMDRHIHIN